MNQVLSNQSEEKTLRSSPIYEHSLQLDRFQMYFYMLSGHELPRPYYDTERVTFPTTFRDSLCRYLPRRVQRAVRLRERVRHSALA